MENFEYVNDNKIYLIGSITLYEYVIETLVRCGGKNIKGYIGNCDDKIYIINPSNNEIIIFPKTESYITFLNAMGYRKVDPMVTPTYIDYIKGSLIEKGKDCKNCPINVRCVKYESYKKPLSIKESNADSIITSFFSTLCEKYDVNSIYYEDKK